MNDLTIPQITPDHDTLTAALEYAKAGWYIGPERRGTRDPGSLLGKGWQHKTSRDPQVITSWFAGTNHGVFLHAGRSGALIIDVDTPENLAAPIRQAINQYQPPYQSTRPDTPGRGHYIFAVPDGRRFGNGLGDLGKGWGEIRGQNGVIIATPSVHSKGGEYRWATIGPVSVLPGYVASRLLDATDASEAATDAEIAAFLVKHSQPTEPRMDLLDRHVYGYRNKVADGESRHHEMTGPLAGAMREAAAGYLDAKFAAEALESVFLEVVAQQPTSSKQGKSRTGAIAKNEWNGLLAWAVGQAQDANPEATRERIKEQFPPPYTETAANESTPKNNAKAKADPDQQLAKIADLLTQLRTWQHLPDPIHVIAALATAATRKANGEPCWLLQVAPPSSGKTETARLLDDTADARLDEVTAAGLLGWSKGKTSRPIGVLTRVGPNASSHSATSPASSPHPTEAAATKCSACCVRRTTDTPPVTYRHPASPKALTASNGPAGSPSSHASPAPSTDMRHTPTNWAHAGSKSASQNAAPKRNAKPPNWPDATNSPNTANEHGKP